VSDWGKKMIFLSLSFLPPLQNGKSNRRERSKDDSRRVQRHEAKARRISGDSDKEGYPSLFFTQGVARLSFPSRFRGAPGTEVKKKNKRQIDITLLPALRRKARSEKGGVEAGGAGRCLKETCPYATVMSYPARQ